MLRKCEPTFNLFCSQSKTKLNLIGFTFLDKQALALFEFRKYELSRNWYF